MSSKILSVSLMISLAGFTGCFIEEVGNNADTVGYRPVYGSVGESEISFVASPQAIQNPGKIYIYGKYLLVNEQKKGIHVFDNTSPDQPVNLGFIKMLGNTDMAIKDNLLYADHLGNLVSLTIDDLNAIKEKGRLPLKNWQMGVPPPTGFNFECVDPSKGIVVSWTKTQDKNLKCYAIR